MNPPQQKKTPEEQFTEDVKYVLRYGLDYLVSEVLKKYQKLKAHLEPPPTPAPATEPSAIPKAIENVQASFQESAAADASAIDGLSSDRKRGTKRAAEAEPEGAQGMKEPTIGKEEHIRRIETETGTDPYKVLGLPRDATLPDINTRYRRLALLFHPDKNPEEIERYTSIFKKVTDARNLLNHMLTPPPEQAAIATPCPGINRSYEKLKNGETDEQYFMRLLKLEKCYDRIVAELDISKQSVKNDLIEINRILSTLSAEEQLKTTPLKESKTAKDEQLRSLTSGHDKAKNTLESIRKVALQRYNDSMRSLGKRSVNLEQLKEIFKDKLNFGKRHIRTTPLHKFMDAYGRRHPRVHPSKVIQKFMRALALTM